MPLLSIITVTLNCAGTICETLDSVRSVLTPEIEYLMIDGQSTDGTLDIIKRYDGIVTQLVCEPDAGIYDGMNKGIRLAKGRYILFINGDDALIAQGFPEVLEQLRSGDADIVSATTIVGALDSPDEVLSARPRMLPYFNAIPHPSSFVRAALLKQWEFDDSFNIAADYDFFLRAYLAKKTFLTLPAITAEHVRGGISDSQFAKKEIDRSRRHRLGLLRFVISEITAQAWWVVRPFIKG